MDQGARGSGGGRRALAALALACLLVLGLLPSPSARAQIPELPPEATDSNPEPFPEVDPYTEGESEARRLLGYLGHGPFALPGGTTTTEVDQTLGGVPILWVETEHFKLASTLKTYRLPGDKRESDKLKEELERLEERLGRLKPPRNELDPWLRMHLFAQRLEEVYAEYCATFGFRDEDFGPASPGMGAGPYLGQKDKFLVLVLEKSSSLGRFTRRYAGSEQRFAYRYGFADGGWAFAVSAEALREAELKLDAALHSYVAFSVVVNLCDSLRVSWAVTPVWFKYGLGHHFSRGVDPRWNLYEGGGTKIDLREDAWRWEPRVRGLSENEVFPPWSEMLAWKDWSEMNQRAHMMSWSAVDWLLQRKNAQPGAYLLAITDPPPEGFLQVPPEVVLERQLPALEAAFGAPVDELEKAWRAHVKRRYPRK